MHPDPVPDSDLDWDLLYGWTSLAGLMALYHGGLFTGTLGVAMAVF
jgi:hypothetical protein